MDESEITQRALDSASWGQVFLVVSLESVVRFWPDMGLFNVCADLRTIAQEHHRRFEEINLDESIEDDKRADLLLNLIKSGVAQVSAQCGQQVATDLISWAVTIFPRKRHLITQPFVWTQILRNAGRQGEKSFENLNVPPNARTEILTVIVDGIVNQRDIHAEVRRVEGEPRSSWDDQKFAEYTEGASPFDLVKEAVLRWRFARVWGRISSVLNQAEMAEFLSWAKVEAGRMGMPGDLIQIPRYD